jgi:uncharacterized protein with PQ loop repeat
MEIAGWVGIALTQVFYIPQLIKIFRTHDVSGMALPSWFILAIGLLSYLIFSVSVHNNVFIAGNAAGMVQSLFMIALILKYGKSQQTKADAN